MQIAQDISLRKYVKKRRRSGLRRGFLACIIREIVKSRCVSYFSTVPKYYDLARSGDELARNHYENLTVKAESCVRCGHCDSRCPFHVNQMARMQEIAGYFNC